MTFSVEPEDLEKTRIWLLRGERRFRLTIGRRA
jgi:hypothetical protein